MAVRIGYMGLLPAGAVARRSALDHIVEAGIDHVGVGDHVSFFTGFGTDGLISASSVLGASPQLPVYTSVFLLVLRHPVPVARQLADLALLGPGRLTFGVGLGGEDPHELEICGVDPHTRGRRLDASLEVLRALLAGQTVSHDDEFFAIHEAVVVPSPQPPIPITVGGRSNAALRRAGRYGDGWLGIWVSARRFAEAVAEVEEAGKAAGRDAVPWRHGMTVWCGLAPERDAALASVSRAMQAVYGLPFASFEKWSPAGRPEDVAEFLRPYVEAGCQDFNLIAHGPNPEQVIEDVGEVRRLLASLPAHR